MTMDTVINEFLKRTKTTKSENTLKTYEKVLKYWFPDNRVNVSVEFIEHKIVEWQMNNVSQNTIVNRLMVLKQLIKFLTLKGMPVPHLEDIQDLAQSIKKKDKIPTVATADQVLELLSSISDYKYKAIISLLFFGGLRVSEVVGLNLADFRGDHILVRDTKNGSDRKVPLNPVAIESLNRYLKKGRFNIGEALFTTHNGRISQNVVQRQVSKHSKEAGFDLNCHAFRHGSATYLLEQGVDLRTIQQFLGHKTILTTQKYTHISEKMLSKVTNAFDNMSREG